MIKVENTNFYYKNNKAINDISLEINEGEFVAIIGVNGSGKSSLIKLISGLTKPKSGRILIDEIDTTDKKEKKNIRKKVGIVFQNPENQLVFTNIEDDMKFMLENFEFNKEEISKRIDEALNMVNMNEYRNKDIYSLSMGQKQRIAVAEMLALRPKYLILDEPTAMLDPVSKKRLIQTVKDLKEKYNITVIYVTNVIGEILNADRIIAIDNGSIVFECTPKTILENISNFEKIGLEIPEVVKLINELNKNGFDVSKDNFNIENIVQEIIDKSNN